MLALVGMPLATMLLVIAGGAFLQVQTRSAGELTSRSDVALLASEDLVGTTIDAETGVQGYALTGDPRFLEPYAAALKEVPDSFARLRALAGHDPRRVMMIDRLSRSALAYLAEITVQVANVRGHRRTAAIAWVASGQGKRDMADFRAEVGAYQRLETERRAEGVARLETIWNVGRVLLGAAVLAALIALACALVVGRAILRGLNGLALNAERYRRGEPLVPPAGTDEIAHVARTFQRMADELNARQGALAQMRVAQGMAGQRRSVLAMVRHRSSPQGADSGRPCTADRGQVGGSSSSTGRA